MYLQMLKKLKVKSMKYHILIPPLIFLLFCEAVFNIIWDAVPAIQPNLSRYDYVTTKTFVYYCAGNKWMWLGSMIVRILLLGINALLAFISRGLRKEQNYSKETALSVYTGCIILVVAIPLGFALSDTPIVVVLLKGIASLLGFNAVILITFFDGIYRIATGREARTHVSSAVTNSTSNISISGGSHSGVSHKDGISLQ